MNVPPPPRPYRPSTTEDENASVGYSAISFSHLGIAAALLLQPRSAAEYLLGTAALPTNVEQDKLMGLLASTLLASATTAWTLKEAAMNSQLETPTNESLQLGLLVMAGAAIATHLQHNESLTNNGLLTGGVIAGLTAAIPAMRMTATERGRRRLGARVMGVFDAASNLFTFRRGFKLSTVLYAALTPLFAGAGLAYMLNPAWTLSNVMGYTIKGKDATFLWRNIGGALLSVLPAMTYSLKEKADADDLATPAARNLNFGLLLASAGHLAVLGPLFVDGQGGKYMQTVVGVWAAAAAASVVGLSSSATDKSV